MKKPSELIKLHLKGEGTGYELDDLMSQYTGGAYDVIRAQITHIHLRYRTSAYPIGVSNPAANDELTTLAAELESQGF